jgi:hypothetical protein
MMERKKAQELMRSLAKEYDNSDTKHVTLLCFCPDERYCHRRLVKEMILSINQSAAEEEESSGSQQQLTEPWQQQPPAGSSGGTFGLITFLIIITIVAAIIRKIRSRGRRKYRERRGFPDYIKEDVLRKQNHRCAHCNKILNVVDWDHKDGNRSNNKESNCQALCPNCHAIKTRRGIG